jgi:hypothetical protein
VASRALHTIPEELQTQEVLDLIVNCDAKASQRKSAMTALQDSMEGEKYAEGLRSSAVYRNGINHEGLKDSEFETQYQACQQALDAGDKAKADAERQRRLLFGLGIAAATLVLVLACGLIIRSSMRATADRVADAEEEIARVEEEKLAALAAVEQKQWDVVATFPLSVLETLPPSVLAMLPPSVLPTLPPSVLETLTPFSNTIGMSFRSLPAGPNGPFSIGVYEVSQEHYEAVMGTNPSNTKGVRNPVETVSWDDAVAFCLKLSALPAEKAARRVYRLPTEAEWEYACRAGTTTEYSFGDDERQLVDYAWFDDNSGARNHPVGQKKPNGFGLYDMHGNVREWCSDAYAGYGGRTMVLRGGSWSGSDGRCRSAYRSNLVHSLRSSDLGFRLALSPSDQPPEAEQNQ